MPKMKTHKSAAKRYKVTATGKIVRRQAGIGHLLQHKSASRKRRIFNDFNFRFTFQIDFKRVTLQKVCKIGGR